jgi:hypothetical protein
MNWVGIQTNTTAGGPLAPGFGHGQCLRVRLTAAAVSDSETLSDSGPGSVVSDAQTQPGRLLKLAASLAESRARDNKPTTAGQSRRERTEAAHCSLTELQVGSSHGPCGGHGHGPAPTRTATPWQSESPDDSDHDDR